MEADTFLLTRTLEQDLRDIVENHITTFILPFYDAVSDGEKTVAVLISGYKSLLAIGAYSSCAQLTGWVYEQSGTEIPVIIRCLMNDADIAQAFFETLVDVLTDLWAENDG